MSEKSEEDLLPHHVQQSLCTTRLPYRQGRKLTAVKVYTINNESKHLLVFGVPSLNLRQETKSLFLKFGKLTQFNITKHPSEQFTETYHAIYEDIASARQAKRMLDTKNFYGGSLHVCYGPELESIEDTKEKLMLRQKNVLARLRNLQKDVKSPVLDQQCVYNEDKSVDLVKKSNKVYMGDVNSISFGKRKAKDKKLVKKLKNAGTTSTIDKHVGCMMVEEKSNNFKIGPQGPNIFLTQNTDEKLSTDNLINLNTVMPDSIEVIDFTSAETETLTNINEELNYNSFGNEIIKTVPYKPVNKIKFNINKNT